MQRVGLGADFFMPHIKGSREMDQTGKAISSSVDIAWEQAASEGGLLCYGAFAPKWCASSTLAAGTHLGEICRIHPMPLL
ncbi:hypothetical protein B1L08_17910 [Aeromonas veronii]|nr:hypothetical protein CVS41_09105 [Aeromonas veronii]MBA2076205.1 hypothetical protein [Aeromonas veronii]